MHADVTLAIVMNLSQKEAPSFDSAKTAVSVCAVSMSRSLKDRRTNKKGHHLVPKYLEEKLDFHSRS